MRSSPAHGSTGSTTNVGAATGTSGAGMAATAAPICWATARASADSIRTIAGCSPANTVSSDSRDSYGSTVARTTRVPSGISAMT